MLRGCTLVRIYISYRVETTENKYTEYICKRVHHPLLSIRIVSSMFFYFRERPKILCNNSAEETAIQVNNPLAEAIRPVTVNPAMTCGATAWSPPPSSPVEVIPSGVRHQAPVEVTTANVIPPNYSLTSLVTFWENPPCK